MCLARSNIRARGHRIQPPGVTQRDTHDVRAAVRGSFGIDPTVTEVIFVRAWFLPLCYECTKTMRIE
jgi:hypothetical protein